MANYGTKREGIVALLGRGLRDTEIAARVGCRPSWVVGVRKDLGIERTESAVAGRRDRVEQAIARGLDDDAIARELGAAPAYVAKVRAAMDRAVARDEQGGA